MTTGVSAETASPAAAGAERRADASRTRRAQEVPVSKAQQKSLPQFTPLYIAVHLLSATSLRRSHSQSALHIRRQQNPISMLSYYSEEFHIGDHSRGAVSAALQACALVSAAS